MEERQGIRITTWNVNGIRNPFSYQPWRRERTFAAMFEILDADIVVMQETKIQRKDLKDDMVLVPGWDVYFSLPKHKKGYSGVAIYTRTSMCAPIRAEEGITGILTAPNSSISFCELPEDQQIGGYPTPRQLSKCALDPLTIDSEGRCVIIEFPAFVLIGVYCPANRDETRDEFRIGFLDALDARVRNLVTAGKQVVLTGDLNIIREELDTANANEQLKRQGVTADQYISTPARRIFNQLLVDGRVVGDRDEGREGSVMWDICRSLHPGRKGMFTCWEQKINARPGNYGSRIDYVLCSTGLRDWFSESNIQEGLLGSDHCPVYAVLRKRVIRGGNEFDIKDLMSNGLFKGGIRKREWSSKDLLPMSAKLIPEFNRRRNIKDMFNNRPALVKAESSASNAISTTQSGTQPVVGGNNSPQCQPKVAADVGEMSKITPRKRSTLPTPSSRPPKRGKGNLGLNNSVSQKTQSNLTGFFKAKASSDATIEAGSALTPDTNLFTIAPELTRLTGKSSDTRTLHNPTSKDLDKFDPLLQESVIDPIVTKESWSKLLGKRVAPRCEHDEPCVCFVTKKPGINCGRSFYLCPRPLGPSGQKEKNSQWRCATFIWSSDWTGDGT